MLPGFKVYGGIAEDLPVSNASYDFALMVTSICFVDDVAKAFQEIWRVLKAGGTFIV